MAAERKSTSLSLDRALLDEAKRYGLNVSREAEAGVLAAVRRERAARWADENRDWVEAFNRYVDEHGVPLGRYRTWS